MEQYESQTSYSPAQKQASSCKSNREKVKSKLLKHFFLLAGYYIGTEVLLSFFVVLPPVLNIFPKALIVSITLCLIAFGGYIAFTIFGGYRILKKIKIRDYNKIAYPAYGVVILISETLLLMIGVGRKLVSSGLLESGVVSTLQEAIVWGFAPLRLFRMFGLNNFYSITISHIIMLFAIYLTYTIVNTQDENANGNIKKIKKKKSIQILKQKFTVLNKFKKRKTKLKEKKQPKRKRIKTKKIFGGRSRLKSKKIIKKGQIGVKSKGFAKAMKKVERMGRRRR